MNTETKQLVDKSIDKRTDDETNRLIYRKYIELFSKNFFIADIRKTMPSPEELKVKGENE